MANQNIDEWRTRPNVIDETVKAAKKFLGENPEEVKKISVHGRSAIIGADMVSAFLGWPESILICFALSKNTETGIFLLGVQRCKGLRP